VIRITDKKAIKVGPLIENHIYHLAILEFGEQAQIEMMIEECAELIQAIQKFKRKGKLWSIADVEKVRDELADVQIMLNQMVYVFGHFDSEKQVKLKRLFKRILKSIYADVGDEK